ncbi:DegV family protein [Agrilactobacillus yilanensis]|uniref:DegV family protein n=1 Tax=Agrilactobacillus yilanensis TaxID=2485997 RepID=A0ABW4J5G4_9LACO|nr:DegV family protein [Agrilactobacillus yilanensis]
MANVKIVTDSSVQLTPEEVQKYEIHVIPLIIEIDQKTYVDGQDITRQGFMTAMAHAENLPKTSQPSIGAFLDLFDSLAADGSPVLAIHMTETISGTVNAAHQAGEISRADVTVVDSEFTDRGMAFQVIEAAKAAQAGKTVPEILQIIADVRDRTHLVMGVSDLTNLVKGGRMSRVSGMISGLLNIKIVLELKKGQLDVVSKGRGVKTLMRYVDKTITQMQNLPPIKAIGISHADGLKIGQDIMAALKPLFPEVPILLRETDPIIATHAGPGAFALMFYTK